MKYWFLFDYIHKWLNIQTWYNRVWYLDKIKSSIWSNTIKVISGIRRVGKSYILKQTINFLLKEQKIDLSNIFYIHFEDERLLSFTISELRQVWEYYLENYYKSWTIYIFLDEIQNLKAWEKFVRNIQENFGEKVQIFITGSNSNMLSSELSTILTWRYIEFEIYPFSFDEFIDFKQIKLTDFDPKRYELFEEYLKYGWLPEVIKIQDIETKQNYLKTLIESIIFKDIVQRYNIKKTQFLESLLIYIYKTTCSNLSINSIVKYLKQDFKTLDYETVNSYIDKIENTFLINQLASRADKTKHILKGKNKFYAIDTGVRNIYSNNFDIEKILENFVFIELKRRWYEVFCIEWNDFEIDFFAKNKNKKLVQVSFTLKDELTLQRELKALQTTSMQYEKIIITMDRENKDINGIKIVNIVDWVVDF